MPYIRVKADTGRQFDWPVTDTDNPQLPDGLTAVKDYPVNTTASPRPAKNPVNKPAAKTAGKE